MIEEDIAVREDEYRWLIKEEGIPSADSRYTASL